MAGGCGTGDGPHWRRRRKDDHQRNQRADEDKVRDADVFITGGPGREPWRELQRKQREQEAEDSAMTIIIWNPKRLPSTPPGNVILYSKAKKTTKAPMT